MLILVLSTHLVWNNVFDICQYLTIMHLTSIIKTPSGLLVHIDMEHDDHCTFPCHPYFRPATSINLTCHVEGARGPFVYKWSSTGPKSFVENRDSSIVSKLILTSDDAGSHTCDVSDSDGDIGSRTIEMKMEGEDLKS